MDSSEINNKINLLRKECEDRKYERKVLATDYEHQAEMVKKSGIVSIVAFLIHYVLLVPFMDNTKHVTIAGMSRFLSPFVMIIFLASFVYFLIKGFDLFVNSDTKYSKKLAVKLKINSVSDALNQMNDTITMLDIEIDKLENELYEMGEEIIITTRENNNKNLNVKIKAGELLDTPVVQRTIIEKTKVKVESPIKNNKVNKELFKKKRKMLMIF